MKVRLLLKIGEGDLLGVSDEKRWCYLMTGEIDICLALELLHSPMNDLIGIFYS
jgi:hypothetical protein